VAIFFAVKFLWLVSKNLSGKDTDFALKPVLISKTFALFSVLR
jgi:hypothetical protein